MTLSGGTDGSKVDETSERRSNQDTSISESEQQLGSRLGPTLLVLPFPAILVGYARPFSLLLLVKDKLTVSGIRCYEIRHV